MILQPRIKPILCPLRRLLGFSGKVRPGCIKIGKNWVVGNLEVLCFSLARRTYMTQYFKKGKGWRYDFTLEGTRYTDQWFETKREAKKEEEKRREEVEKPQEEIMTQIDMDFLTLVNMRLDYVKKYNSEEHFRHVFYHSKRWVKEWKGRACSEIKPVMVGKYVLKRAKVSGYTANKEIRYLRALFNFGINLEVITQNPASAVKFLPVTKKRRYVPPKEDIYKVIEVADPDSQDYLWTMILTAARMGEINFLTWDDVDFGGRYVTLWTNKRRYGNRESRDVPMLKKLYDILFYRYQNRDPEKPWVFWHRYWSRKANVFVEGPYKTRGRLMKKLCEEASVKYFRFHPFRHFTASILDDLGTPIGVIQRILGHSNRRTTEGYLHSIGEAERNAMNRLESIDLYSNTEKTSINKPVNKHKEFWLRKVERPDYIILCQDIMDLGYVGTGKKYGVSNNTIKKWKQYYETQFKN